MHWRVNRHARVDLPPVAALEKQGAQIMRMPRLCGGGMVQLAGFGITDAGLVHLKGLTNPKILILADTQLTGAAEPKKALPKCRIQR